MMDIRSLETHYLVEKGLTNINNPFLMGITEKNRYQLKDHLNPHGVAFFIAPVVNAVNRAGTIEEKKLLLDSMLEYKAYNLIPSTKRGCKDEEETIVEQAVRTSGNVRARQNRVRDKQFENVMQIIADKNLEENKLIIVCQNNADAELNGLVANQVAGKLHRPILLVQNACLNGQEVWAGSGRNAEGYGIEDLRGELDRSGLVNFAQGHKSAFGISIPKEGIKPLVEYTNKLWADCDFSPRYKVDAIYNTINIDGQDIISVAQSADLWGQNIEEPLIVVENIQVSDIVKAEKFVKFRIKDNIWALKWAKEDDSIRSLEDKDMVTIVGKCGYNTFDDTPQVIIEDYQQNQKQNSFMWDF